MLFASILAGVPVFRRASSIPADSRLPERLLAEKSPILPPSVFEEPTCIKPRRKVPVVRITHCA